MTLDEILRGLLQEQLPNGYTLVDAKVIEKDGPSLKIALKAEMLISTGTRQIYENTVIIRREACES